MQCSYNKFDLLAIILHMRQVQIQINVYNKILPGFKIKQDNSAKNT